MNISKKSLTLVIIIYLSRNLNKTFETQITVKPQEETPNFNCRINCTSLVETSKIIQVETLQGLSNKGHVPYRGSINSAVCQPPVDRYSLVCSIGFLSRANDHLTYVKYLRR